MLQLNSVANVGVHRTCTPLYEKYEATPYNTFLDPTDTNNIYSGMVMFRTGPDTVALATGSGAGAKPFGLSALDRNPNIDDVTQVGVNSWAVWLGGSNAFFTITAPAFDTSKSYTVNTDGTRTLLYTASGTGQLTSTTGSGTTLNSVPVAELIDVISPTQIVVRLIPFGATA
jgi:hypothetical protein